MRSKNCSGWMGVHKRGNDSLMMAKIPSEALLLAPTNSVVISFVKFSAIDELVLEILHRGYQS